MAHQVSEWRGMGGRCVDEEYSEGSRPPEARPPKREAEPKPGKPKEYVGQHVLVGTYCYCVVQCIEHVHDHVLLTPLRCGAGLRAVLHAYCPSRVAPSMSTSTVATPVLSTKPSR